jgi:hypothetical protein
MADVNLDTTPDKVNPPVDIKATNPDPRETSQPPAAAFGDGNVRGWGSLNPGFDQPTGNPLLPVDGHAAALSNAGHDVALVDMGEDRAGGWGDDQRMIQVTTGMQQTPLGGKGTPDDAMPASGSK